ncbi:MAG: LuxR C-terminal-related transcriptional regulator [Burkholderiaceae bacterium]
MHIECVSPARTPSPSQLNKLFRSRVSPSVAPHITGTASDLLLKVTPRRVPSDLVVRSRLKADQVPFRDRPAIIVQAPAGFGKTSLLAQWRREHLARGTVVAWLSAQAEDNPERFVQSLALAVRVASGRPTFGRTLLEGTTPGGLEGVTTWLAEVAQSALDIVLIVDAAEHFPAPSRQALTYLLHNAPANLRTEVSARSDCNLAVNDLVTYGQCIVVGTKLLRFRFEETQGLVRARFGTGVDTDTTARLHELTEGWPLGLQLALAAIAKGSDARAALNAMTARAGGLHDYFVSLLVSNLDPEDAAFLTRVAVVDSLHPDLCRALTLEADAPERLARLARETPIFVTMEDSEWLRMHSLARDVLRFRAGDLAPFEQNDLHARASHWLAGQGMLEDAARHALAAGERETAYDLADRCLYDALLHRGHLGAVLDWVGQLPAAELDKRPRLRLTAAWALSVSARHQEAEPLVARILKHAGDDVSLRCECALIVSGAATYADDPDRFAELNDPWAESPPLKDPVLLYIHANRQAFRALLEGDPAQARLNQQRAPRAGGSEIGNAFGYIARWGEYINALSYLWEGQVMLAENLLRSTLASAEADLGRRNPFACVVAALLATAAWEAGRADASTILANRLDVLERSGLPDPVLFGYRTIARIAAADGAEHRALELLEGMHAVGVARKWPRLCIASLAEQVRVHAWRARTETCRALCERIDTLVVSESASRGRLWRRGAQLLQLLAHADASIAAQDWHGALGSLKDAATLAETMNLGRRRLEIMALRAYALDRRGEQSVALLQEAIGLASTYGLVRVFVDAHPAVGEWAQRVSSRQNDGTAREAQRASTSHRSPAAPLNVPREREAHAPRVTPSMALTPKEREVLALLARNLSNKEIALAMQVGEETIKWHLKNLFGKLDAGTRKHVVRRAHLLGLLEPVT